MFNYNNSSTKIFRNFLSKGYGCAPRPPWPPRAGPTSRYLAPHVKTCVQKPHARACNLKSVRFARGWWSTLGLRCYVLCLTSFHITCIESNYLGCTWYSNSKCSETEFESPFKANDMNFIDASICTLY